MSGGLSGHEPTALRATVPSIRISGRLLGRPGAQLQPRVRFGFYINAAAAVVFAEKRCYRSSPADQGARVDRSNCIRNYSGKRHRHIRSDSDPLNIPL
jgi:hypothetical protein